MRILIIEDTDSIRRMLQALVSARADEIVAVGTGEEGLDKAFATPPHVVLLDLGLPGLYNGLEVCSRLRADPKTRRVPIFIITASADRETEARAMKAGATRFFPKPFSPMAILKEIDGVRRSLGSKSIAAPAATVRGEVATKGDPASSLPARPTQPSPPLPRRPESSGTLPAVRESSPLPVSDPRRRT
jgi:DNA-binding response OmpR family regulator